MLQSISAQNSLPARINYYFWMAVHRATGIEKIVRLRLFGRTVFVRTGTHDLTVALSSLGSEFETILNTHQHLGAGLIIDAGGYIGTAAMKFAEAYPDCEVVTIEPSSENLRVLTRNVAGLDNVVVIQAALAPESGERTLKNRNTGQWGYTVVDSPDDTGGASAIEVVPTITVTEVLRRSSKDRIDILKLDIEGGEYDLLSRNIEWLSRTKVVIAELHDRIVPGCTEVFDAATEGRINYRTDGEKVISEASGSSG